LICLRNRTDLEIQDGLLDLVFAISAAATARLAESLALRMPWLVNFNNMAQIPF